MQPGTEFHTGRLPHGEQAEVRDFAVAQDFAVGLLTADLAGAWRAGETLMRVDIGPLTEAERADGVVVYQFPDQALSFDRSFDPMAVAEALSGIEDPARRQLRALDVMRDAIRGGLGVQRAFRGRTEDEPEAGIAVLGADMLPRVY